MENVLNVMLYRFKNFKLLFVLKVETFHSCNTNIFKHRGSKRINYQKFYTHHTIKGGKPVQ